MTSRSTATVIPLPVRGRAGRIALPTHTTGSVAGIADVVDRHDPTDVYRALAPAVLGYLRSQRVADPEDVLGEVFHGVARDLPRFRGDQAALRRWVFTIAHHRLVDDHRRRARRREEPRAELPEPPAAPEAGAVDGELIEALDQLTPEQRYVVTLRFVADLPLRDVARITGRRVGAVKALQARALANLRRLVEVGADTNTA
jgi:RNA polymerase sigma-70 factor (ECF subfamily)